MVFVCLKSSPLFMKGYAIMSFCMDFNYEKMACLNEAIE